MEGSIKVRLLNELDKYGFRVNMSQNPYTLDFTHREFDGDGNGLLLLLLWEYRKDRWVMHGCMEGCMGVPATDIVYFDNVDTKGLLRALAVYLERDGFSVVFKSGAILKNT